MPELIQCPECQRQLKLPESLMGQSVKCPSCGVNFTAPEPGSVPVEEWPALSEPETPNIPALDSPEPAPPPPPPPPPTSPYPLHEETPRPQPRPPREDWDEYDHGPRRRRRLDYAPHRGSTVLVLGILGLVVCNILGPIAWVMGNNDMEQIRMGYMDPEGEGLTQAGRICGMIATIFLVFGLGLCCLWFAAVGAGGAAGGF